MKTRFVSNNFDKIVYQLQCAKFNGGAQLFYFSLEIHFLIKFG